MRYFTDRMQAGKMLAEKLAVYKKENCAVICLTEGSILIGLQIAKNLHASIYLLVTENINLPREPEPIAVMTSAGTYTPNNSYSTGDLEVLTEEFHGVIDQQRMLAFQKLNRLSREGGEIPKKLLKNHIVILVSDGIRNGLSLDVAADFLKPINLKKIIVATPIASVPAVDKMHLTADEIYCLNVIEEYLDTDHYYENNQLPDHQTMLLMVEENVYKW